MMNDVGPRRRKLPGAASFHGVPHTLSSTPGALGRISTFGGAAPSLYATVVARRILRRRGRMAECHDPVRAYPAHAFPSPCNPPPIASAAHPSCPGETMAKLKLELTDLKVDSFDPTPNEG